VQAHIAEVIEAIAPHDSVERFEGLGVTVLRSWARFIDPRTIEAGDVRIRARRFALATGSVPFVPPIPGLDQVPYLTDRRRAGAGLCPPRHQGAAGGDGKPAAAR
jgi:pyruvate/2-oxoglutarate dehydrogenase complex dihydrolipoamide dehydrogenase (E3) component